MRCDRRPENQRTTSKDYRCHKQTLERLDDLQKYKPTPEELAAHAIRVEKHVTVSEKTGKTKIVSYDTFRGNRRIKHYSESNTNNDGEIDLFMEVFRVGAEKCAALTRSTLTSRTIPETSMLSYGVPHISVMFEDKDSDGKFDELLLMKDNSEFMEHYRRDADGLMQPVPAEEYLQTKHATKL